MANPGPHPRPNSASQRLPLASAATSAASGLSMAGQPPLVPVLPRTGPGPGPGSAGGQPPQPPSQPQRPTSTSAPSTAMLGGGVDPSVVKLTRGHSCVLCQQRKVRCDKNKPCANCVKANAECRVIPPQPPRRRKKKPQERELLERLRRYESLLNQNGVSFDPMSSGAPPARPHGHSRSQSQSQSQSHSQTQSQAQSQAQAQAQAASQGLSPSQAHTHPPTHNHHHRTGTATSATPGSQGGSHDDVDELQRDLVGLQTSPSPSSGDYGYRDSSDDELEGSTIHHAFDSMFDNQDGFPFIVGGLPSRVTDCHPTGVRIFQLWQIYLTNVNPLLKVTHTPTLQAQITEAGAHIDRIPRGLEALMFSIYFVAVTSMSDDDVLQTFDEDRTRLLARYHRAAQQALINAGFMRSPDLVVLQAFFLYLISVRQYVDPRSLFCLIGIAVRIAQRLGLHRDGATQFRLPPFEAEMRRRLWWQIVAFDKRIAEITGSVVTALSSGYVDTQFPLNVNDTDLHLQAKDARSAYTGATEMLFCLTRVEMCMVGGGGAGGLAAGLWSASRSAQSAQSMQPVQTSAASPSGSSTPGSTSATTASGGGGGGGGGNGGNGGVGGAAASSARRFHYSPSPSSPDVVTHVANQTLPDDPESFCTYMENKYLRSCEPKIPLHLFTVLMTRQALCKMRIIHFLSRTGGGPAHGGHGGHGGHGMNGSAMPGGASLTGVGGSGPMGPIGGVMGAPIRNVMNNMMGPPPAPTPSSTSSVGGGGGGGGPAAGPVDDAEREALVMEAIHMIEFDNEMQSTPSLRGFLWYTYMHFPFPAYMFLVMELRSRLRTGDLAERAWTAICENHDRRGLSRNPRSPIHVAFGGLFVKAWDVHETALAQQGCAVPPTPTFIRLLQQQIPKTARSEASTNAARPSTQNVSSHYQQPPTAQPASQQHPHSSMVQQPLPAVAPPSDDVTMEESPCLQQQAQLAQVQAQVQAQQQAQAQAQVQQQASVLYATNGSPGLATAVHGAYDGIMPGFGMGMVGMSEMMDFGSMDWNVYAQTEFAGYNGFGNMYGPPGSGGNGTPGGP